MRLPHKKSVHLFCVKALVAIKGNERADYLAKYVIKENIYDKIVETPIPISKLKYQFSKYCMYTVLAISMD